MSAATFGPHRRHTRRDPCPVCDHPSWCVTFEDGWTLCQRRESERPTKTGGWLHWTGDGERPGDDWRERLYGAGWSHRQEQTAPPPPDPKAEPDIRHLVYRRLAVLCGLSDAHRADLHRRGITDEQIAARGYATLPATGRKEIAAQLLAEFGAATMERIPGFRYWADNAGRRYPTLAGGRDGGLLVPVRDPEGRIAGYQVRRDNPPPGTPRYRWLSSKDRDGGTGSGAPVHVARPVAGDSGSPRSVVITEGPIKADIASDHLGCVVVAVPGVTNRSGVLPALAKLDAFEGIIGYDRDAETKPQVMQARDALAADLAAAGYRPLLAIWDDAYKGLDDALVAGLVPTITPYPLPHRAGQLEPIPAAAVPTPPLRRLRTISEAHAEHARIFRELLMAHAPGCTVIASPTGAGKTDGLARALRERHDIGEWPVVDQRLGKGTRPARILYAAPTKEAVSAFRDMTGGLAMAAEGRNPDHTHEWGCHRPEQVFRLGEARHNPAVDVCTPCKDEYQAAFGRTWTCNYLTMKAVAENRKLIAAPIASYFNNSTELRKFDVVIVDEAIVPALTETVTLTQAHLRDWLVRMNEIAAESRLAGEFPRYGLDDPFRRFANALHLLLEHVTTVGKEWTPALPLLRELCPDLPTLVDHLLTFTPNDTTHRYAFETPRLAGGEGLVPLRLARDLIEALAAELDSPTGADTRLWLTPE
ncbi:MAG: DUF3854 domain-containing protein, partial [Chloroflexota bacterium]|nr:DUF3854 domain-containing protein [Chloroflexota bacterium]